MQDSQQRPDDAWRGSVAEHLLRAEHVPDCFKQVVNMYGDNAPSKDHRHSSSGPRSETMAPAKKNHCSSHLNEFRKALGS